jgi:hypothetical protein
MAREQNKDSSSLPVVTEMHRVVAVVKELRGRTTRDRLAYSAPQRMVAVAQLRRAVLTDRCQLIARIPRIGVFSIKFFSATLFKKLTKLSEVLNVSGEAIRSVAGVYFQYWSTTRDSPKRCYFVVMDRCAAKRTELNQVSV